MIDKVENWYAASLVDVLNISFNMTQILKKIIKLACIYLFIALQ